MLPRRGYPGLNPAARSWHRGGLETVSSRSHLPLPASARGLRNQPSKGYRTRGTRGTKDSAGDAGGVRRRSPLASYVAELRGCKPRNFPAPARRAREAQLCVARLPALTRRGGTEPLRPRPLRPAPWPQPGPRDPMFPQLRARRAGGGVGLRPLQTCSLTWGQPRGPRRAGEDMCSAAGPLESCRVPLACFLGTTWLHVLVTHQESRAPHGSQRTHTTGARPAQPPRAQRTALRPGPPSARPSPAPPPAETPAPAHCPGGKTLQGVGSGVYLQNCPGRRIWAARLGSLECLPPSHAVLPFSPKPQ